MPCVTVPGGSMKCFHVLQDNVEDLAYLVSVKPTHLYSAAKDIWRKQGPFSWPGDSWMLGWRAFPRRSTMCCGSRWACTVLTVELGQFLPRKSCCGLCFIVNETAVEIVSGVHVKQQGSNDKYVVTMLHGHLPDGKTCHAGFPAHNPLACYGRLWEQC